MLLCAFFCGEWYYDAFSWKFYIISDAEERARRAKHAQKTEKHRMRSEDKKKPRRSVCAFTEEKEMSWRIGRMGNEAEALPILCV